MRLPEPDYEPVVHERQCEAEHDPAAPGIARRRMLAPRPGSALWLDSLELAAGNQLTLGNESGCHELVYVLSGAVELENGPTRERVDADAAFLSDPAAPAKIVAHEPTRLVVFGAGSGCDEHAPMGERASAVKLDLGSGESATGKRSFQIMLGPESGCTRATMFVGAVPPGAAPWHFHQYDEIVYLLDGAGAYHQAGGTQTTAAGSAVRIPARTVHINENTTDAELRVLGVFTPAGSPSAAYLADDPRPR